MKNNGMCYLLTYYGPKYNFEPNRKTIIGQVVPFKNRILVDKRSINYILVLFVAPNVHYLHKLEI